MLGLQSGSSISIADIGGLIGLSLTVFGLIFAGVQLRQNNIARRAEILLSIIDRYFSNQDERSFFYKLDYGQFVFDPKNFGKGNAEETMLDSILYNLDVVGRMLRLGAISQEEVKVLVFEVHRIMMNSEVQKYLKWLESEYEHIGLDTVPFQDARYLSERLLGVPMISKRH
jgi:hypothetical protein